MGLIITDYSGSSHEFQGIAEFSTENPTKTTLIKMYGMDKDLIQKLGASNRFYEFRGITQSQLEMGFLENITSTTGSMVYSTDIGLIVFTTNTLFVRGDFLDTDFLSTDFFTGIGEQVNNYMPAFFYDLEWIDEGTHPMYREFILRAAEIGTYGG